MKRILLGVIALLWLNIALAQDEKPSGELLTREEAGTLAFRYVFQRLDGQYTATSSVGVVGDGIVMGADLEGFCQKGDLVFQVSHMERDRADGKTYTLAVFWVNSRTSAIKTLFDGGLAEKEKKIQQYNTRIQNQLEESRERARIQQQNEVLNFESSN